jgi:hypothetical protein
VPFDREKMKQKAAALAASGVFIGTSSWKYEGWFGQLYTPERYEYRGKVAKTRFERACLSEYAEVFKTVCVQTSALSIRRACWVSGASSNEVAGLGYLETQEVLISGVLGAGFIMPGWTKRTQNGIFANAIRSWQNYLLLFKMQAM